MLTGNLCGALVSRNLDIVIDLGSGILVLEDLGSTTKAMLGADMMDQEMKLYGIIATNTAATPIDGICL